VSPCWSGYVSTDDVDARHVEAAGGGAIRRPPTDSDASPVLSDPGGAVVLLFKSKTTEEPKPVAPMTPGHIGWHELMAAIPSVRSRSIRGSTAGRRIGRTSSTDGYPPELCDGRRAVRRAMKTCAQFRTPLELLNRGR
jgi:hypothetical protein